MKFNLDLVDSLNTELLADAVLNAQNFLTAFALMKYLQPI
jgi:hypothetical protein